MIFERSLRSTHNKINFFDVKRNIAEFSDSKVDSIGGLGQKNCFFVRFLFFDVIYTELCSYKNRGKMGEVTSKVVKRLYAESGNECSSPNCEQELFKDDPSHCGQIAHIYAKNMGGARYDPSMSEEERNGYGNLILLCSNCHNFIDSNPEKYPPSLLIDWKNKHKDKVRMNDPSKFCKALKDIIIRISNSDLSKIIKTSDIIYEYNIKDKIDYNKLIQFKQTIKEYSPYHVIINSIYREFQERNVLQIINHLYLEVRKSYIITHEDYENSASIISNNSDKIFGKVRSKIFKELGEKEPPGDIDHATTLLVVYAFINCKILERPTNVA